MERRVLLSSMGLIALSGCISDNTSDVGDNEDDSVDTNSQDAIEPVTVNSEDLEDTEAEFKLNVQYNSAVQNSVAPDSMESGGHSSQEGEKYLVLRMVVENIGDQEIDLVSSIFGFESDGELYSFDIPLAEDQIGEAIDSEESGDGWLVTSISEGTTEGILRVDENQYYKGNYNGSMNIEFEKDDSLNAELDEL